MNAHSHTRLQLDAGPYTDEQLAHLASLYETHDVAAYGVQFWAFVQAPQAILDRIASGAQRRLDDVLTVTPEPDAMLKPNPETVHAVLAALRHHIGRASGVTAEALVAEINSDAHAGRQINARDLRHLVTELRLQGHHVCAHPGTGYYLAETPEELDASIAFLRDRALSSLQQISAMTKVSLPDLMGQLHLPT